MDDYSYDDGPRLKEVDQQFHDAVKANDLARVKAMLTTTPPLLDVNTSLDEVSAPPNELVLLFVS